MDGLVTCGLTACTPGSALGPTLGNEYGRTLPFFHCICNSAHNIPYYLICILESDRLMKRGMTLWYGVGQNAGNDWAIASSCYCVHVTDVQRRRWRHGHVSKALSHWKFISKFISKFMQIGSFRRKISSVNSQLSKELNFEILFRNFEHVLFRENLRKKLHLWSDVIGQSASVYKHRMKRRRCCLHVASKVYFQCERGLKVQNKVKGLL